MLQIVTKMYFRAGVQLHSTVHRAVLYTNLSRLRADLVGLPVGELAWSTGTNPVSTATLSITEHLEAEHPDGRSSVLVATAGTDLVDDLADVLSFGLNAVFNRDGDLVSRLVPNTLDASSRTAGAKLFRRTFEPHRFVTDAEIEELRRFLTQLLGLKRGYFERAMRAISRIARATQRAIDDPTIAYVDLVAALESLSDDTDAPAASWQQMDGRKRRLIDFSLEGTDEELAVRVRRAVIEAERLGASSKFVAFVNENLSPSYYRSDAIGAVRPMSGADLERALKLAYQVRSRNVHVLEELPPEAWALGDGADTVSVPDLGMLLSLEGLVRLARHVIRNYVDRAPTGVEESFDWRASLPGQLRMRLAPQYWIWKAEQFDHKSADRYFGGFVNHLVGTLARPDPELPDMRAVLERIEGLLRGTADGPGKSYMIAIYALWHHVTGTELHRPDAERTLRGHSELLNRPAVSSFVVGLLSGSMPAWTPDEWYGMAKERREERSKRKHLELPAGLDAALQVIAADEIRAAGRTGDAITLAAFAVEDLPGNEGLISWEAAVRDGHGYQLDLGALIPGLAGTVTGSAEQSAEPHTDDGEQISDDEREN